MYYLVAEIHVQDWCNMLKRTSLVKIAKLYLMLVPLYFQ